MEETAFTSSSSDEPVPFDPLRYSRASKRRLPASRYQFRPPKYYRGPLHPYQPPKPSDPASREFIPGPFSLPRLHQTYHDTVAADLMTLSYQHLPPGHEVPKKADRLRAWTGDNPYFKNRPLRGPRGGDTLRLLRKPIKPDNIPRLERVTVHTMVKEAMDNPAYLQVAAMAMQAITNVRTTTHKVRRHNASFRLVKGQEVSVTCELHREDMYHFISKLVDVVLPKIKDYRGIKGTSGDNSGNIAFGFTPEQVALFPEIEVNYDM